jgi:hypothetical protein
MTVRDPNIGQASTEPLTPSDKGVIAWLKTISETIGENTKGISVAASQTDYTLQISAGAVNDYLAVLMIVPGNTSPGAVTFKDGTGGASITAFPGGANSVAVLAPFPFVVNARSVDGAWSVTTGANVTVWASGEFS